MEREIPDEKKQRLELEDSSDVEVPAERVDEPQMQANLESQMQDDQTADVKEETGNETSVDSTGTEINKSSQPTVEKCDEVTLNTPENPNGLAGMEHEKVTGECQKIHQRGLKRKRDEIQETTQMVQNIPLTERASEPSESEESSIFNLTLGEAIKKFLEKKSSKPIESSESICCIEPSMRFLYGLPEIKKDGEVGINLVADDQPEQELRVQQAEQSVALVAEEAVICHAIPEQMEEVKDIEEPQQFTYREKDVE